jgi:hypothetical protein
MDFVTKDTGLGRREFGTGSVRDVNTGKPRFDLIPIPALKRWAGLMARGAEKYGERNWELGQSMSRFEESALRHLYQYLEGDRVEDHLAAVLFNVGGIMHHESEIAAGKLPADLDDRRPNDLVPRALAPVAEHRPFFLDPGGQPV